MKRAGKPAACTRDAGIWPIQLFTQQATKEAVPAIPARTASMILTPGKTRRASVHKPIQEV
jgi:hypothetical protein